MKKTISFLLLTIISFAIPKNTFAWGKEGHHIIAEIAFNYLDEATKQAIKHYLGKMSFEEAAEWMDDNRSNSYYDFMKSWHYIDIAKGQNYQPSKEKNVLTVLNSAIIALEHKQGLNDRQIKEYLLLVFHLVGDLHQPLHTGYPSDKGGNLITINSRFITVIYTVFGTHKSSNQKVLPLPIV